MNLQGNKEATEILGLAEAEAEADIHTIGQTEEVSPATKRQIKARTVLPAASGMVPVALSILVARTIAVMIWQIVIWIPPWIRRALRPNLQHTKVC